MAFLTSLQSAFNIYGTTVEVVTDDYVHSQRDRVSGNVIIRGSDYEQRGRSITLELKEFWTETRSSSQGGSTTVTVFEVHEVVTLANEFTIQPRSEQSYQFEVRLPMKCRISTGDTGWRLVVTMDIPKARDPTGEVTLHVRPAEEFIAIIEACESDMRFEWDKQFLKWDPSTGATHFRLIPPPALKSELDYIRLELLQGRNAEVTGSIVFDLQEKSLTDYFKAIIGRDQIDKPIALAEDDIFLPDNESNVEAITRSIGRSLYEVLSERGAPVDKRVEFGV